MSKFLSKYDIDFRQTKYKLPAIMYIPVFIVGCLFINIFYSGDDSAAGAENRNDYIDGSMPTAKTDSTIQGKSLDDDYGGTDADGRLAGMAGDTTRTDASGFRREDFSHSSDNSSDSYNQADLDEIRAQQEEERVRNENYRQMQNRVRTSPRRSVSSDDDYVAPVSDNEIARVQQRRRERMMRDINSALYGSDGDSAYTGSDGGLSPQNGQGYYDVRTGRYYPGADAQGQQGGQGADGYGPSGSGTGRDGYGQKDAAQDRPYVSKAHKIMSGSRYFNTISDNSEQSTLIEAIIDENIKCVEGSRVRLKLLDDIDIDGHTVRKGTRLYVTMSGFGSQRVKGNVKSILLGDRIFRVDLAIYDMDGIEGLYVPESSFRQSAKDIGSSFTQGATDFNTLGSTTSNNPLKSWASNAVSQSSQRVMDAIRKRIEKNVVHLKFGTRVYLINSSNIVEAGGR